MKTIRIKKDFTLKGNPYFKGDDIESREFEIEEIIKLNEKGFIEPLTQKEIVSLIKEKENGYKSFVKPTKVKEGENDGSKI